MRLGQLRRKRQREGKREGQGRTRDGGTHARNVTVPAWLGRGLIFHAGLSRLLSLTETGGGRVAPPPHPPSGPRSFPGRIRAGAPSQPLPPRYTGPPRAEAGCLSRLPSHRTPAPAPGAQPTMTTRRPLLLVGALAVALTSCSRAPSGSAAPAHTRV